MQSEIRITDGENSFGQIIQGEPRRFEPFGEGRAILEFSQPQRALTPGQVCALYDGETLLGGGVFEEICDG